jgi:hypothetical protein
MSVQTATIATLARRQIAADLAEAGIEASVDVGSFYPTPVGVLVGLPALVKRGLASRTFEVPVLVVSGDPLNAEHVVDRVYALADAIALALRVGAYSPSSWRSSSNAEPLPALELPVTVTVQEEA